MYKSIRGNSRASFKLFIEQNNLEYLITRKNDDRPIENISINDGYVQQAHKVFVSADSIAKIENFMDLLERNYSQELKALEKIVEPVSTSNTPERSEKVETKDEYLFNFEELELTDEEKFRDTEDNIVKIDVRGTRSESEILFRAKDISKYLGMDRLIETLNDERCGYERDTHWVKLFKYSDVIISSSRTSSRTHDTCDLEESEKTLIWKRTYLTLNGLLKVIFSSKSANENVIQLRNWVIHLVFTHQFGSPEQRDALAIELTDYKKNLNDKRYRRYPDACGIFPGLYCIKIGKVKELRESMDISTKLYPPKEFDTACVYKFGRAEDIMSRYAQHSSRTKYGKYGKITLDWFVTIPKSFLPKAENDLAKHFKSSGLMFEYNDGSKDHTELIIAKTGDERKQLKDKYKELVGNFPSNINELSKQLTDLRSECDQKLETTELKSEVKILNIQSDADRKISDLEVKLLNIQTEAALKIQELTFKNEILELKLAYATK